MTTRPLLPLPDYQRIYQIIHSVLDASGIATTHRSCLFFASVGAKILREFYRRQATISAGCMAIMVDEQNANVMVYGRVNDDLVVTDADAFHAWVECDGWLIDFMAPIMGRGVEEDGHAWNIPRRMLQKRLIDRKSCIREIEHLGDFYISHDRLLAESLFEGQPAAFGDLMDFCMAWFRRPPRELRQDIMLADSHGPNRRVVISAPSIQGRW